MQTYDRLKLARLRRRLDLLDIQAGALRDALQDARQQRRLCLDEIGLQLRHARRVGRIDDDDLTVETLIAWPEADRTAAGVSSEPVRAYWEADAAVAEYEKKEHDLVQAEIKPLRRLVKACDEMLAPQQGLGALQIGPVVKGSIK